MHQADTPLFSPFFLSTKGNQPAHPPRHKRHQPKRSKGGSKTQNNTHTNTPIYTYALARQGRAPLGGWCVWVLVLRILFRCCPAPVLFVRSWRESARFVGYRSASVLVGKCSRSFGNGSGRLWIGCEGLRCSFGCSSPMLCGFVLCPDSTKATRLGLRVAFGVGLGLRVVALWV